MPPTSLDEMNRAAWTRALQQHQVVYPDERLVVFLSAHYADVPANRTKKALDIGFGSGRHLRLLKDYGFEVAGLDYIENAASTAKAVHGALLEGCDLRQADLRDRPFPHNSFDVILCWGVLFLRRLAELKQDLANLHALLKPGGRMALNFRTTQNWFYGKGKPLDEHAFLLDESAGPYAGMCYSFFNQAEARGLLQKAGFIVENCERVDLWKRKCQERHSWWVFWVRKPL